MEGESKDDWLKPVNFEGEFPGCGKPTGRIWLDETNAKAAARQAVQGYYGFTGQKLDDYCKENVDSTFKHFDVLNEGKFEIERGP